MLRQSEQSCNRVPVNVSYTYTFFGTESIDRNKFDYGDTNVEFYLEEPTSVEDIIEIAEQIDGILSKIHFQ